MAPDAPEPRGPLDPRILGLSVAIRTHLVVCAVLAVVTAVAVLVQAEAISRQLPRLIDGDQGALRPMVLALAIAAVLRGAAATLTDRSATRALVATRSRTRARILDHVARLRPDARPALGPARAGALTTTAADALEPWLRAYLPNLTLAVAVPVFAGLRILGADVLSAVILALVIPLIPLFMVLIGRATENHADRQWETLQRLSGRFLDVLTGLPTLRLFGRAQAQVERVREVTDRYRAATMRTLRVAFLSALVLEVLATLSVALLAVELGSRLTGGHISLQRALLVLLLAPECLLPLRRVGAAFHAATAGQDAATEIGAALELPIVAGGDALPPARGVLVATGVEVIDPERGPRLAPISLRADPGRVVAVVGPSGSGKSTLLDVLRGALVADAGTVALGDTDIGGFDRAATAAAIRWVPQGPQPLGTSVRASAAIGHPDGPDLDAAVERALVQLDLDALADLRPDQISGGERRRLALARALVAVHLGAAPVLLLDEPTAQLDATSARRVIDAIRLAASSGAAVVVATHDPDLEAAADECIAVRPPGSGAELIPGEPGVATGPAGVHELDGRPTRGRALDEVLVTPTFPTEPAEDHRHDDDRPVEDAVDGHGEGDADRGALRWLLREARPQRARLVGAQALGVLTEACAVGLAGTAAWLIVRASEHPSFADLAVAAVAVRAFGVSKGFFRYADRLTAHDATLRLLADLRSHVVDRLVHLAPTGLPEGGRGELLTRLVDDIDRLQDLFLRVLGPLVSLLVVAFGTVALVAVIDPPAALVLAVATVLVGGVLPWATHRSARRRGRGLATARGRVAAQVVDLVEHADELVACGGDATWRAAIEADAATLDALDRRHGRSSAAVTGIAAAVPALASAAVASIAMQASPALSGPALGVVVLLPLTVIELLGPLSATGNVLAVVEASAVRVRSILRRPDPVVEPAHPAPLPDRADLVLADASVGWPGAPPQVTGIDLAIEAGDRAVISGPSGSGKSTIANALVRFLAPSSGTYAVGGTSATDLGGEGVRRLVTWCQQEPWFADSTLGDNLRVARPDATDEALWSALRTVHLDTWARDLPAGLDTRLRRDAEAMSGGQRQRLALARALLGGHGAIVFDEPTAHLDAETAGAVMADLLAATAEKAVVVIAHDDAARSIGAVHHLDVGSDGRSRWRRSDP